jgi:hypothetical protein
MPKKNLFEAHDKDIVSPDEPILKNTKGIISLIVGKKRSGKSTLWYNMITKKELYGGYFHNIFLISPSKETKTQSLREELDSEGKYFSELTQDNIKKITDYMTAEQQKHKAMEMKLKKKLPPIYNLIIFDDCVADLPRTMKKSAITNLFYNTRHYNASIFCVTQSYKNVAPNLRKQADLLYVFPTANLKELEAIQEDWSIPEAIFEECFRDEDSHPFLTVNLCGSKPRYFNKLEKMSPMTHE